MIQSEHLGSSSSTCQADIIVDSVSWQPKQADKPILRNLSASFPQAEFSVLIGPNGAGKTSLLKLILGFFRADQGQVTVGGKALETLRRADLALQMAYLPQESKSRYDLSVYDVIAMSRYARLSAFQEPRAEDYAAIEEAIRRSQCEDLADKNFSVLSGGERQRVLCARAIAQESRFILLDEPVSSLDLKYQHTMLDTLRALCQEKDVGIICVMHDVNLAAQYADKVLFIKEGTSFAEGPVDDLLTESMLQQVYEWPLEALSGQRGETYFVAQALSSTR